LAKSSKNQKFVAYFFSQKSRIARRIAIRLYKYCNTPTLLSNTD